MIFLLVNVLVMNLVHLLLYVLRQLLIKKINDMKIII